MGLSPSNTPFDVALVGGGRWAVGGGQVTFVAIFHRNKAEFKQMKTATSHFISRIISQSSHEFQALDQSSKHRQPTIVLNRINLWMKCMWWTSKYGYENEVVNGKVITTACKMPKSLSCLVEIKYFFSSISIFFKFFVPFACHVS